MKAIFLSTLLPLLTALAACTATTTQHPNVTESVSLFDVSCTEPYTLTKYCNDGSGRKGPLRPAEVDGYTFLYASTQDGRVIRMVSEQLTAGDIVDTLTLGVGDVSGFHLEKVLLAIESVLNDKGVHVTRIVPIIIPALFVKTGDLGQAFGYFLELDGDGYAVLEKYADSEDVD